MHRDALGEFLRSRRERADPVAFGLSAGNRRTPGLRRSEAAELANISEIHYANIEQARGAQPSPEVLAAVARGLRLDTGQPRRLASSHRRADSGRPHAPDLPPPRSHAWR